MPKHDLEVRELLQAHQAGDCVKTICFTSFRIDSIGQSIHYLSLLNATSCGNFLNQGRLSSFSLIRGHIGPKIGYNEGLESVGNSLDLFIRPVNALVFKFARDGLRAKLSSCFGSVGDLGGHL